MKAIALLQKDLGNLIELHGKRHSLHSQNKIDAFNSFIKKELDPYKKINTTPTLQKDKHIQNNKDPLSNRATKEKIEKQIIKQETKENTKTDKPQKQVKTKNEEKEKTIENIEDKETKLEVKQKEEIGKLTENNNNNNNIENNIENIKNKETTPEVKQKEEIGITKNLYDKPIYNILKQIIDKIEQRHLHKPSSKTIKESKKLLAELKALIENGSSKAENINTKELENLYRLLNKDNDPNSKRTAGFAYEAILVKVNKLIENQIRLDKTNGEKLKGKQLLSSKWSIKKHSNTESKSGHNNKTDIKQPLSSADAIENSIEIQETPMSKPVSYGFRDMKEQMETNFAIHSSKLKLPDGIGKTQGHDLFNQVIRKAVANISPNRSEVRIQLEPKVFGNITLNILMDNGVVSGSFNVDNSVVKKMLEDNLLLLKENLEAQGFSMDNIDISYKNEDAHLAFGRKDDFAHYSSAPLELQEQEEIMDRYIMPEWMAKEVNMVI